MKLINNFLELSENFLFLFRESIYEVARHSPIRRMPRPSRTQVRPRSEATSEGGEGDPWIRESCSGAGARQINMQAKRWPKSSESQRWAKMREHDEREFPERSHLAKAGDYKKIHSKWKAGRMDAPFGTKWIHKLENFFALIASYDYSQNKPFFHWICWVEWTGKLHFFSKIRRMKLNSCWKMVFDFKKIEFMKKKMNFLWKRNKNLNLEWSWLVIF